MRFTIFFVLWLVTAFAHAIDSEPAFDDPQMQARYERMTQELRCLVCQNQTIADSNADLASDLRREVREMMTAGADDGQIVAFMVERYGDFVLYRPPLDPRTWLLWGAPFLLLLLGGVLFGRVILRRAGMDGEDVDEEERPQALGPRT